MLKPNQKYVTDAGFQEGSLKVSLHFFLPPETLLCRKLPQEIHVRKMK